MARTAKKQQKTARKQAKPKKQATQEKQKRSVAKKAQEPGKTEGPVYKLNKKIAAQFSHLAGLFDPTGFDKETLAKWYRLLHLGRKLDERAATYLKKAMGWSYHAPYAGHDGIQLAIGLTFRPKKDFLFPYYRDMLTCLAGGITVEEILLNGLSKDADVAGGGRHMSNHFAKPSIRIQNVSSCVANHGLHAVGVARAIKKYGGDEIAIYSSGESGTAEGYFYEAVNAACTEVLPVIFVIQNNHFGISVPVEVQSPSPNVASKFRSFRHLMVIECDGRDPFDSYRAMQKAREYVLSGRGPAMVHAECDRQGSHSNSDDHLLYRTPEEIEEMKRRDPVARFRATMLAYEIFTEEELEQIEQENLKLIEETAAKVEKMPDPAPESWKEYIIPDDVVPYEDDSEYRLQPDPDAPVLRLRQAINWAMKEEFRRNPNTFLWGQDVASKKKQGIFKVCEGMLDEFGPERVFNAPIAEDTIVGTANGMCRYREDIHVVIEGAQFADYFWPAMEQYIECTHEYWRTKGQYVPNVVIRLASGGYIQGGLYHSQSLDAIFTHLPGARVVYPTFADDAIGLMRHALRARGVTVYLEPKFLYNHRATEAKVPHKDVLIPFGKAKIRRPGTDVTLVSYGTALIWSLQVAEELEKEEGISVEVIDLRSLRPWDKKTVYASVQKTNRVVIAHEHPYTGGWGGEIASAISEEMFQYLDAPVLRVASKDCPIGFAKTLENAILVQPQDIKETVLRVVRY